MKTKVMFRKWRDGRIEAVMPYLIHVEDGRVSTFSIAGSHSSMDYDYILRVTEEAIYDDYIYIYLLGHLETNGGDIQVIKEVSREEVLDKWYKLQIDHELLNAGIDYE